MTTERDDLGFWSADWQLDDGDCEIAVESIRRGVRRYAWATAGSWLVGLTMLLGTTFMAWRRPEPPMVAAAVAVWIFVAAAAAFDFRYRRGTWKLAGETTRDYLGLARRQLGARLAGLRFGWGLLGAETLFFALWIPWVLEERGAGWRSYLESYAFLAVFVTGFAIGLAVMRDRARRELERLGRAERSLVEPEHAA